MKKITLSIVCILLFAAQHGQAQGFSLGIKGGADILKVSGKSFDQEFAYGYHLGGFVELKLNKTYSLQPELYYSSASMNRGNSLDTIYTNVDLKKIKLDYINIPLILNIKPSKKISIQVGPRYGILANSNLSVKKNAENAFKSGDFSMLAGIQFNFSKIRVYGRYQIGLTDINDATSQEKWKSQTIHVGVGLKII
jgi:hypothetical protein